MSLSYWDEYDEQITIDSDIVLQKSIRLAYQRSYQKNETL